MRVIEEFAYTVFSILQVNKALLGSWYNYKVEIHIFKHVEYCEFLCCSAISGLDVKYNQHSCLSAKYLQNTVL
jgi:hypothetical protein